MMRVTFKRFIAPITLLGSGLVFTGLAAHQASTARTLRSNVTTLGETQLQLSGLVDPLVTVNGQPVDLGADKQAEIKTNGATIEVSSGFTTSTSEGNRTETTNDDGSINISVESNSSSGSSRSTVKVSGDSDFSYRNNSSTKIKVRGEGGNISVTNE